MCNKSHDPEPYEQYTMMTGQVGWPGSWRFKPRPGFCQNKDCYDKGLHKREQNTGAQPETGG